LAAEGKSNTAVAEELKLSKPTVGKWRKRFLEQRLDGLIVDVLAIDPDTFTVRIDGVVVEPDPDGAGDMVDASVSVGVRSTSRGAAPCSRRSART
jgi:hypothetical protein